MKKTLKLLSIIVSLFIICVTVSLFIGFLVVCPILILLNTPFVGERIILSALIIPIIYMTIVAIYNIVKMTIDMKCSFFIRK